MNKAPVEVESLWIDYSFCSCTVRYIRYFSCILCMPTITVYSDHQNRVWQVLVTPFELHGSDHYWLSTSLSCWFVWFGKIWKYSVQQRVTYWCGQIDIRKKQRRTKRALVIIQYPHKIFLFFYSFEALLIL